MFFSLHGAYVLQGFPEELAYQGLPKPNSGEKTDSYHPDIGLALYGYALESLLAYQGAEVFIEFFYPFAFGGLLAGVLLYWTGSTWAKVAVHGEFIFSILSQIILACWMVAIVL